MNILLYVIKFLYRIRWWLIIGVFSMTLLGIFFTKDIAKEYEVTSTVYTGIVSGVDIETVSAGQQNVDMGLVNNSMDNLMNILTSRNTLRNVSLRLFAEHMMYGDPNKDNQYITAENFRIEYSRAPQAIKDLIDKSSEERTISNLKAYEKEEAGNYIFDLFNYGHPFYSYSALSKITTERVGNSDMLEMRYSYSDPGITYKTIEILYDVFVNQYRTLRFDEIDDVIKYFESELAYARSRLTITEDSLTNYNIEKRVINYDEQTKTVTSLSKEHELSYESVLLAYSSSQKEMEVLDKYVDENVKAIRNNKEFIAKLKNVTDLSTKMILNFTGKDSVANSKEAIGRLMKQSDAAEKDFLDYSMRISASKFTKDGVITDQYVPQWFQALVTNAKSEAELKVLDERQKLLDDQYVYYSPIGTTIKRKEREISFNEQTYLSVLDGLNAAKLRKKNFQLYSSSLKLINPPLFPITSKPTKRKSIVLMIFFGSAFFIIGYFALMELLDRTLKNKDKAEWLTGGKVIAAYPNPSKYKYKIYNKQCEVIAVRTLANTLLNYYKSKNNNPYKLINFIAIDEADDIKEISAQLVAYFESMGISSRAILSGEDFMPDAKEYLLADDISDICTMDGEDMVIMVHPLLKNSSIPSYFIVNAGVNLFFTRSIRVWSETDQMLYGSIVEKSVDKFVPICLTKVNRDVIEVFTGMLPPYTSFRKLLYRLLHFGLSMK